MIIISNNYEVIMSQQLKNLNISTKFLSSDEVKEIIYNNTIYTEDTSCIVKTEKINSCMVWDNYNIDSRSMKYIVDID